MTTVERLGKLHETLRLRFNVNAAQRPLVVQWRTRLNTKQGGELHSLGLSIEASTKADKQGVNRERAAEATARGLDAYRFGNRTDKAGVKIADTGRRIWGADGARNVTFPNFIKNLGDAFGMRLVYADLQQDMNDRSAYYLRLYFTARPEAEFPTFNLKPALVQKLNMFLGRTYDKTHGWKNPTGWWTFNACYFLLGPNEPKPENRREIRFDREGRVGTVQYNVSQETKPTDFESIMAEAIEELAKA